MDVVGTTVVETIAKEGQVPIRIEVAGLAGTADLTPESKRAAGEFYAQRGTRGPQSKLVGKAVKDLYKDAMNLACACADETSERLAEIKSESGPQEFEVTFALNMDADLNWQIVSAGGGAQVQVRMQWNRGGGD
jgi:Trypsin-co-occurring domain 1